MMMLMMKLPPVGGRLRSGHNVLLVRQHEASNVKNVFDQTRFDVDVHRRVGV